jgi:hypothetical protein
LSTAGVNPVFCNSITQLGRSKSPLAPSIGRVVGIAN